MPIILHGLKSLFDPEKRTGSLREDLINDIFLNMFVIWQRIVYRVLNICSNVLNSIILGKKLCSYRRTIGRRRGWYLHTRIGLKNSKL